MFSTFCKYSPGFVLKRLRLVTSFNLDAGKWQLKRHPANIASVHFWDNVINEYTNGRYELIKAYPGTEYADGTLGDVYFFENI